MLRQDSLSARHTYHARVTLYSLPQSARGCLKRTFQNVMSISPAQTINVQIEPRRFGKRTPEMLGQLN
jgi:hypothetical protein